MKLPTHDQLVKRRATTVADMQSKMEAEDWHGVQDCGSDLREIDAMLAALPDPHTQLNAQIVEGLVIRGDAEIIGKRLA